MPSELTNFCVFSAMTMVAPDRFHCTLSNQMDRYRTATAARGPELDNLWQLVNLWQSLPGTLFRKVLSLTSPNLQGLPESALFVRMVIWGRSY